MIAGLVLIVVGLLLAALAGEFGSAASIARVVGLILLALGVVLVLLDVLDESADAAGVLAVPLAHMGARIRRWLGGRQTGRIEPTEHEMEMRVVQVPSTLTLHPRTLEKYCQQRSEIESLLTPEALAKLDAAEAEASRRLIGGTR